MSRPKHSQERRRELDAAIAIHAMGQPIVKGYQIYTAVRGQICNYLKDDFVLTPDPKIPLIKRLPKTFYLFWCLPFNRDAVCQFQVPSYDPYPERYSTDIRAAAKVLLRMTEIKKFNGHDFRFDMSLYDDFFELDFSDTDRGIASVSKFVLEDFCEYCLQTLKII